MSDVNTPSAENSRARNGAALVRTLMGGTAAMRAAGALYLPPFMAETTTNYKARIQRSVLFNGLRKTVVDMTGRVFAKPIVLGDDMPEQLKAIAENVDNAGRHLNVFARDIFFDALQSGIGFIFADMPPAIPEGRGTGRNGWGARVRKARARALRRGSGRQRRRCWQWSSLGSRCRRRSPGRPG